MPIYSYRGLDSTGREIKKNITSDGLSGAKNKIRAEGIMLIDITQKAHSSGGQNSSLSFKRSVSIDELSLMTRQLATLIRAKIQIVDALSALTDQAENHQLRVVLAEIKQKVNEGTSLAQAFSDYPKIFNNIYINMVEAGEASGTLDLVLIRLAEFTEAQVRLKNKIKGAMIYPVIMMAVGFILMSFIFIFVIPKITKIFVSMKKELPIQTELCIWISDFIRNYWWGIIISSVFFTYTFRQYIQTPKGKNWWHYLLLRMPLVGKMVTMINASRFSSTLATLLNSGVPILSAMKIVKNLVGNIHMQKALDEASGSIREGGSLSGPLSKSRLYPAMMTHMIQLGERSGELAPMLKIVAENYEEQVDNGLNGLTATLEPVMMVCMGMAVGFIIFSVIAPMMELNSLQ